LLRGLQYLREAKAIAVEIFGDSELVIKQLNVKMNAEMIS
jgi:ribonuclease HI